MQPTRFYFTLLIALISVANGLAQGINFGPTYEYETRKTFAEFINQTDANIYLLRCRNPYYEGNLYIEKYDNSLSLVSTKTIVMGKGRVIGVIPYQNFIWVFKVLRSLRAGQFLVTASQYAYDGKKLDEQQVTSFAMTHYAADGEIILTVSPDKNRLLFYTDFIDDTGIPKVKILVTDSLLNSKEIVTDALQTESLEYDVDQMETDNNGNFFMLSSELLDLHPEKKKDRVQHQLIYHLAGEENLHFEVLDSNQIISSQLLRVDERRKQVNIGGYYAKYEVPWIEGSYHACFGLQPFETVYYTMKDFTDTFRRAVIGERMFVRGVDLRDYDLRDLVPAQNGFFMIGENAFTAEQANTNFVYGSMQTSYKTTHHFNDIIVEKTDSQGKPQWMQVLKKKQTSVNDLGIYSGYFFVAGKDSLQFIYNNLGKDADTIMQQTIYADGWVASSVFLVGKNEDISIVPGQCRVLPSGKWLLIFNRDDKFQLGLVE